MSNHSARRTCCLGLGAMTKLNTVWGVTVVCEHILWGLGWFGKEGIVFVVFLKYIELFWLILCARRD